MQAPSPNPSAQLVAAVFPPPSTQGRPPFCCRREEESRASSQSCPPSDWAPAPIPSYAAASFRNLFPIPFLPKMPLPAPACSLGLTLVPGPAAPPTHPRLISFCHKYPLYMRVGISGGWWGRRSGLGMGVVGSSFKGHLQEEETPSSSDPSPMSSS